MSIEWFAALLAVLALAAWYVMRGRPSDEEDEDDSASHPYHGVAINPGEGACRTAQTLKGLRFLSDEAPLLPLASCDASRCRCTFTHFKDRRRGDRRNPYRPETLQHISKGLEDRRTRRGRRTTDGMHLADI
ncbi:hypothetical protein [Denitromonas iodatirespirans]|uniref:Uncharacterized protein n=1 Tax=Denitromonas iodatirespirans TaxID=2795389 RepID=A0A944DCY3_DENI1|nr:hypothetical protein [Denitromonas iodatirespirans]MBT0963935.1 hypothetical protein [Denitromonas iodatirespirans]